jgi:outer membrane lipoprotein-sorting protein
MRKLIQWCGSLGLIVSVGAHAADAVPSAALPQVEYSADRVISAEQGGKSMQMNARVNYAKGKERNVIEMQGKSMISIMRHDKKLAWMVMPDQKMYMETSYAKQAQYCHWPCVNIEKAKIGEGKGYTTLGQEVVNGVETTKYKITCIDKKGETIEGIFWVAANGVVMKMDFTTTGKGGKSHAVIELRNLKIAEQDPGLFEIPKGYSKLDMSSMPLSGGRPAGVGGGGGMGGVGGAGAVGSGLKDLMKGLIRH